MYKVLRHTCFDFELFAINATSARLPHLKTLTWQTVTLTDSHYLADQATRLGGSTHLSCARDQDKIRNYRGRRVTSPTWVSYLHVNRPLLTVPKIPQRINYD